MCSQKLTGIERIGRRDVLVYSCIATTLFVFSITQGSHIRLLNEYLGCLHCLFETFHQLDDWQFVPIARASVDSKYYKFYVMLSSFKEMWFEKPGLGFHTWDLVRDLDTAVTLFLCFDEVLSHCHGWLEYLICVHAERHHWSPALNPCEHFVIHFDAESQTIILCYLLELEAAVETVTIVDELLVEERLQPDANLLMLLSPVIQCIEVTSNILSQVQLLDQRNLGSLSCCFTVHAPCPLGNIVGLSFLNTLPQAHHDFWQNMMLIVEHEQSFVDALGG